MRNKMEFMMENIAHVEKRKHGEEERKERNY